MVQSENGRLSMRKGNIWSRILSVRCADQDNIPGSIVAVCLQGNGDCPPRKENSRMSVDLSANTPNGQEPQGPKSPSGKWLLDRKSVV